MAGKGGAGEGERGVYPRFRDAEREALLPGRSGIGRIGVPDTACTAETTLGGWEGTNDVALVGGEPICDPLKLERRLGVC